MKVTARQLNDLTEKELVTLLQETQEQLRHLRFEEATGQLKQKHKIKEARIKIARINTILHNNK